MDFETDSKVVVDSIYKGDGVSDFMAIIHDCRHLLMTDLANSDVKFIRRQANMMQEGFLSNFILFYFSQILVIF